MQILPHPRRAGQALLWPHMRGDAEARQADVAGDDDIKGAHRLGERPPKLLVTVEVQD